jgi:hypothetical protein
VNSSDWSLQARVKAQSPQTKGLQQLVSACTCDSCANTEIAHFRLDYVILCAGSRLGHVILDNYGQQLDGPFSRQLAKQYCKL